METDFDGEGLGSAGSGTMSVNQGIGVKRAVRKAGVKKDTLEAATRNEKHENIVESQRL